MGASRRSLAIKLGRSSKNDNVLLLQVLQSFPDWVVVLMMWIFWCELDVMAQRLARLEVPRDAEQGSTR
jgi:hypothetical protein